MVIILEFIVLGCLLKTNIPFFLPCVGIKYISQHDKPPEKRQYKKLYAPVVHGASSWVWNDRPIVLVIYLECPYHVNDYIYTLYYS